MDFLLVPDELKQAAASCAAWLTARGWTVNDADDDLSFPLLPSMTARRDSALQVVEVIDEIDDRRVSEWTLYGKSAGGEVKVSLCIRASCASHDEIVVLATRSGFGLYVVDDGAAVEMVEARDLSATTTVPDLTNEDQWVREALGQAVEEYGRTNWQEGLRRATTGFEGLCRARLIQLLGQGARFSPVPERKTPPTSELIERSPLGPLRIFFSMVDPSTAESSTIVRVIGEIIDPRNDISHKNDTPEHRSKAVKLFYVVLRGARELRL